MDLQHLTALGTNAAIVVYLIQWLKKQAWFPWASAETARFNHGLAIVAAIVSGIGINVTFQGSATAGWSFTGHIPSLAAMWVTSVHIVQSYIAQRVVYDGVVKPAAATVPAVAAVAKQP